MTIGPATFGWLCVETILRTDFGLEVKPATFGWLCVETLSAVLEAGNVPPATFGWLCVETAWTASNLPSTFQPPSGGCVLKRCAQWRKRQKKPASHLRVAVC